MIHSSLMIYVTANDYLYPFSIENDEKEKNRVLRSNS